MKDIKISPALNGFIVKVGCQMVVFESVNALIDNLRSYLTSPVEVEKAFVDNAINAKFTMGAADAGAATAGAAASGGGLVGRARLSDVLSESRG